MTERQLEDGSTIKSSVVVEDYTGGVLFSKEPEYIDFTNCQHKPVTTIDSTFAVFLESYTGLTISDAHMVAYNVILDMAQDTIEGYYGEKLSYEMIAKCNENLRSWVSQFIKKYPHLSQEFESADKVVYVEILDAHNGQIYIVLDPRLVKLMNVVHHYNLTCTILHDRKVQSDTFKEPCTTFLKFAFKP